MRAIIPAMESKLPDVGTTIFTVMSALANECNALNLSQGFPDYDGPQALREALAKHVMEGNNQYAPMAGVLALREQISTKLQSYYGVSADPDTEITVVPGATEAIYCAITACVQAGDEVIVFDPSYDSYEPAVTLNGGVTRHLAMVEPDFSIDWDEVADSINERTRLLIINSPHNPTGAILRDHDLHALEKLVLAHDLYVVSDEVYEHLVADAYRAARVHLYPGAESEVYCSTLAESQAVGLPAVSRRLPAATERIRNSESGFVVPDDEAFANCAMLLLHYDQIFRGRSDEARDQQRGRDWDAAAAEFAALFS